MTGIRGAAIDEQLAFVRSCCAAEVVERAPTNLWGLACADNGVPGYGLVEALFLHCFIAHKRPSRIVQIGCGVSTSVILRAARSVGYEPEIVCVEPYPTDYLTRIAGAGEIVLLRTAAQEVSLEELTGLAGGDLLFIDSTHTVKPGSEVNRIVLEVLPRLAPGVFVHLHDIWFPYDYSPVVLTEDMFFWSETVLLQAFLTGNAAYTLRASLSMLHHGAGTELPALLGYRPARIEHGLLVPPLDDRQFPTSTYLEVTAAAV